MTNSFFASLLPGKWKGISFLVSKETLNSIGAKWVQHDYPGTNIRYMEFHGINPFQATMDITFNGLTFVGDFKAFKNAMEDQNPGTLYLPTIGVFTNVIAMPTDATSDQSNFGEIPLTVTFTQTVQQPSPTDASATQEDVFTQGLSVLNGIFNSFLDNYLTPSTLNNLQTAVSDISSMMSIYQKASGAVFFSTTLINAMVNNPATLASSLFDQTVGIAAIAGNALSGQSQAYIAARNLATVGNTLSNSMQDINSNFVLVQTGTPAAITINTNISVWPGTTYEQQQRNINRYCLVNAFRIGALVLMCEQAGLQQFTTAQQVQSVINDIQNYFNLLIENDTTIYIINDCKPNLEILKNNTINTLYNIQQQLSNVRTIVLEKPMNPRVLAGELYLEYMNNSNDLDFYTNILLSLNSSQPVHLFPAGQPISILQI